MTLKQGEEAELAVSELSGVPLLGCSVQISLYRGDNLLSLSDLPPSLCVDDASLKTFAETFGPVEKCFLMRFSNGLCFPDFFCNQTCTIIFILFIVMSGVSCSMDSIIYGIYSMVA